MYNHIAVSDGLSILNKFANPFTYCLVLEAFSLTLISSGSGSQNPYNSEGKNEDSVRQIRLIIIDIQENQEKIFLLDIIEGVKVQFCRHQTFSNFTV